MSPRRPSPTPPANVVTALARLRVSLADEIRTERLRRRWTLRQLAEAAGLSVGQAHAAESGQAVSLETYCRLSVALGQRLEFDLRNVRVRAGRYEDTADLVHSAMGERQVVDLQRLGFKTGVDEPYQHFQFAGRADVLAWDLPSRALLHIENRTMFPDMQAVAGSWNAKRQYLPPELGKRLGVRRWASITHLMAALWTDEVVVQLRQRQSTFKALCPDGQAAFDAWWSGRPPASGVTSTLVMFDPSGSHKPRHVGYEEAIGSKAPYRGYADAARLIRKRTGR